MKLLKKYMDENHDIYEICGLKIKIKNKYNTLLSSVQQKIFINKKNTIKMCKKLYANFNKDNFVEKYKKLIEGLDDESIRQISTIIARIIKIATSNIYEDIFTEDEVIQINKLKKEFENNIIKLNENCFAYRQYLLPINHFEPHVFHYKYNIDELNDFDRIRNKNIIDVGGYIGDSAILLKDYTNCKVYSFEPETENFDLLNQTIELNNAHDKIVPVKLGLGSKDETQDIYIWGAGSSLKPENKLFNLDNPKESINITTLDKFVEENNLEVGLIKVDIEGFEQEFLKGAINTIKSQKPALLLSIYHNVSDLFDIKPYIESLDLGYKLKIRKPTDGNVRGDILLIAE